MTLFVFFLFLSYVSAKLKSSKVVYAIDCGGPGFKGRDGVVYRPDDYYDGGVPNDFGTVVAEFRFTDLAQVYQTERYDIESFTYRLPIPKDGKYVLILKFSEVWFDQEGDKVFSVKIGDKLVVRALDIYSIVGKNSAYDEFIAFELRDQEIYIGNREVEGAFVNDCIIVDFVSLGYDNPKVNGIVLLNGDLEDTHYADQQMILETLQKQRVSIDFEELNTTAGDDYELEIQLRERRLKETGQSYGEVMWLCVFALAGAVLWKFKAKFMQKPHKR